MYDLGKLIKQLRSKKNVSMDKMCEDFQKKYDVSLVKSTISKWENNRAEPSLTNAKLIADYFGVTLDYFLGIEQYDVSISEDEKELLNNYDKLNDLGKHEALKRVEELTFIDKYVDTEYLMPIAAHAKDGVSKEDIKHDLEMMNDENW